MEFYCTNFIIQCSRMYNVNPIVILCSRRPRDLTLPAHLEDIGRGVFVIRTDPLF